MVGALLPAVMHEMRNPLASAVGVLELLLEEVETSSVRRELALLQDELRRVVQTVDGVAALEHGVRPDVPMPVEQHLRDASAAVAALAARRRVIVLFDVATIPPLCIDTTILRALVQTMLEGALEGCEAGDMLCFEARLEGPDQLKLELYDSGHHRKALSRWRPPSYGHGKRPVGNEVALALLEKLVCEAGAHLEVHSRGRRGNWVRLSIPHATTPEHTHP